jgi:hypothetical protein
LSTMPQERWNAQWVREQGVGLVIPSVARIGPAAAELIAHLPQFHAATARLDNRAVFEVPEVIASLLMRAQRVAPPAWHQGARSAA